MRKKAKEVQASLYDFVQRKNADMSAISFAMTIHGLMDYELDQKYGRLCILV